MAARKPSLLKAPALELIDQDQKDSKNSRKIEELRYTLVHSIGIMLRKNRALASGGLTFYFWTPVHSHEARRNTKEY